jgi:hypothetical protein
MQCLRSRKRGRNIRARNCGLSWEDPTLKVMELWDEKAGESVVPGQTDHKCCGEKYVALSEFLCKNAACFIFQKNNEVINMKSIYQPQENADASKKNDLWDSSSRN